MDLKKILIGSIVIGGLVFGGYKMFFSSCCSVTATSGCTPSNCRGAKTKFGEAKVISELRLDLIDLKSEMETSEDPHFHQRSYDIHGIIGNTDAESIDIIINELKLIENEFAEKLNYEATAFELPENKAKQIDFLSSRIRSLKEVI